MLADQRVSLPIQRLGSRMIEFGFQNSLKMVALQIPKNSRFPKAVLLLRICWHRVTFFLLSYYVIYLYVFCQHDVEHGVGTVLRCFALSGESKQVPAFLQHFVGSVVWFWAV